jgi:hypothetical protein
MTACPCKVNMHAYNGQSNCGLTIADGITCVHKIHGIQNSNHKDNRYETTVGIREFRCRHGRVHRLEHARGRSRAMERKPWIGPVPRKDQADADIAVTLKQERKPGARPAAGQSRRRPMDEWWLNSKAAPTGATAGQHVRRSSSIS